MLNLTKSSVVDAFSLHSHDSTKPKVHQVQFSSYKALKTIKVEYFFQMKQFSWPEILLRELYFPI